MSSTTAPSFRGVQLRKAAPLLALVAVVGATAGTATTVAALTRPQPDAAITAAVPSAASPASAGQPQPAGPPATAAALPALAMTAATLDVDDQVGDGRTVLIGKAAVSGAGHVAVFTADGRLLGSSPVSGVAGAIAVQLEQPVTGPTELHAVLYADDGNGTFEPASDPRVVDSDGDLEDEGFDYAGR